MYVSVYENVAVQAAYTGLHQWNFCFDNDTVRLWNKSNSIDLNQRLKKFGDLGMERPRADQREIVFYLTRKPSEK